MSVLVEGSQGERRIISKGAPEAILARCLKVPASAGPQLDRLFDAGARVVAVASRAAPGAIALSPADETGLSLDGFLTFGDPLKHDARESLQRLATLGIAVKLVTGDNPRVAAKVCGELGLPVAGILTGSQLDEMDDHALLAALPNTSIFARVTPEQKSRIIRLQRAQHTDVAFLGDGVNDAVALHDADVGISVDSATDVAKDAADIVLLEKDLGILADGVLEGRRIFSNTIKYVLMGTSSNFGNMFSAAGASLFLPFLPMMPTQILLNNLLYDVSEMTIPTDRVDPELLERPAQWDIRLHPPLHDRLRADQLDLRLPDVRRHALRVSRHAQLVSDGLVRRIAGHADTGDLRHPHPPRPVLPQPARSRARPHQPGLRDRWRDHPVLSGGGPLRLSPAAGRVFRHPRHHGRDLPGAGGARKSHLLRPLAPSRFPHYPYRSVAASNLEGPHSLERGALTAFGPDGPATGGPSALPILLLRTHARTDGDDGNDETGRKNRSPGSPC